jgi:hypothetical protein
MLIVGTQRDFYFYFHNQILILDIKFVKMIESKELRTCNIKSEKG